MSYSLEEKEFLCGPAHRYRFRLASGGHGFDSRERHPKFTLDVSITSHWNAAGIER